MSVSASHEEQLSLWRAVVLFYIWADNKTWAHKIGPWKYLNYLKFSSEQSASFLLSLLSTLNSFLGVLKISSICFNPCRGRWQVPICRWQWEAHVEPSFPARLEGRLEISLARTFLDLVCLVFEAFCICISIHKRYWPVGLSSCVSLSNLGSRLILAS